MKDKKTSSATAEFLEEFEKISSSSPPSLPKPFLYNIRGKSTDELGKKVDEQGRKVDDHDRKIIYLNYLLAILIIVLVLTVVGWYYDTVIRFSQVKEDYYKKTSEFQNEINLLKEEIKNLRDNNNDFQKSIFKSLNREIEYEVNKRIIDIGFKSDNH